jgi:hypothetical protein
MKKLKMDFLIAVLLLAFSAVIFFVQFLLFNNFQQEFFYLLQDLAFMGIQALIVYFLLDTLLNARENEALLKRLNVMAGLFFYENGVKIFDLFSQSLQDTSSFTKVFCVQREWRDKDFAKAGENIAKQELKFTYDFKVLEELKALLRDNQVGLIHQMENPGLHEHETFSDMLMALFHLTEELLRRQDLRNNDATDQQHILDDIQRVYRLMAQLWLEYMRHLKVNYPYLYNYNIKNRHFKIAVMECL